MDMDEHYRRRLHFMLLVAAEKGHNNLGFLLQGQNATRDET